MKHTIIALLMILVLPACAALKGVFGEDQYAEIVADSVQETVDALDRACRKIDHADINHFVGLVKSSLADSTVNQFEFSCKPQ